MAIVSMPSYIATHTITCAICKQPLALSEATAGLYDPYGHQMFACNKHVWNKAEHLVGWADLMMAQQDMPADALAILHQKERGAYGEQRIY